MSNSWFMLQRKYGGNVKGIFGMFPLELQAEAPITKEIKMPPSDDPDGNTDLNSKYESSGNNSRSKYRKALKFDMKRTPVVEKLGSRPAQSSKETEKSLSACILRQLNQCGRQFRSEKNFMYNSAMPSSLIA
ncbi:adipogenin isoform X2 [Erythrolamprus reginae]|uniref:adipogenin isoform X2 n=1 Tax=Erythrolamprus reginae TaxID=121349 RepID=UPI00396C79DE